MPTTTPSQIRASLAEITTAGMADVRTVTTAAGEDPTEIRAALFAAVPIIVSDYGDAAAELALQWYEQLREAANPRRGFVPTPRTSLVEDDLSTSIALATSGLHDLERQIQAEVDAEVERALREATEEALRELEADLQRAVADDFRGTVIGNADDDPDAVGWRRFARPEACKFCKMLADRGAVYTRQTARFAAHGAVMRGGRKGGNCMCIAGPAFGGKEIWAEATPMQYVASKRVRTPEERAALREYLNDNFPDAPG